MYSTHEADLDIPGLPLAARRAHIVPALSAFSLVSIGQLCDSGCEVTFDAKVVTVNHNNHVVLSGKRDTTTGLWHLNLVDPTPLATLPAPTEHQSHAAVGSATPAELVAFSHAALFSPVLSTLVTALDRNYLSNFPGLSAQLVRKYPPQSIAMVKGHLDQSRKNQRSTKMPSTTPSSIPPPKSALPVSTKIVNVQSPQGQHSPKIPSPIPSILPSPVTEFTTSEADDTFPTSEPNNARTHHCYASIITPAAGKIHTDQTGQFIIPSSTGNNYLLIVYDYDSNSILAEPIPRRTGPCILLAYQTVHARLVAAGLRPQLQRLDNECSEALKDFFTAESIDYQLVPPGMHRRNAAERAIRTFKNHFIAGLCSVDKHFPLHLWDKLVPQAEATLNLLRGSRINPKLSAYAQLQGTFDFNRTPIAPPGIRVLVHVKPDQRTTWSPHATDGWYIGPAMESYRCYQVWVWETRALRICDTISWFPTKVTMPLASSTDLILAGIQDILHALQNPSPGSALAPLTDSHTAALNQLASILTSIIITPACDPTGNTPPPLRVVPVVITDKAQPLRVATIPHLPPDTPTIEPAPLSTPTITPPVRKLHFAPLPSTTMVATFQNSTGIRGKHRRQAQRKTKPRPLSASKTHHPNKTTLRQSQRPQPTHSHGTRANQPLQHVAASARSLLIDSATVTAAAPIQYALLGHAINPDTGKIAEYRELSNCSEGHLWQASNAEEIGRLAQGYGSVKGTNTMFFIPVSQIPQGRKATYLRVVSAFRPEKSNPRRVRWTVGGDKVDYPFDVSTKTADLTTAKLLFNSVLSTPTAKFMTLDLKDFYLGTPMTRYEYMRIPLSMIPADIIAQYNLETIAHNRHVYVEIRRGMYGLPQAGRIANDQLTKFLAPHGYHPLPLTPGLWKHNTRDITFSLVVDDFGVKYTNKSDADHLILTLEKECKYQISVDWEGTRYCGLTLAWDYVARTCDVSMPGYIERALQRFHHPTPSQPEHAPHPWQRPNYGAKTQYADAPDTAEALNAADTLKIQEVLGTLLFYARAIDSTLLTAIGELATEQAGGTKATMEKLTQLLNYCATHPDAIIRYTASDMILAIESDASYLSVTKARSRAAGFFFLTNALNSPTDSYKANGALHVLCHIMREVLSSAAEAELGALFHNGKEACPLRIALHEMGHPQPATPIATDNSTACGIATDTVKQRRSKAIDMRFYWIRDRVRQGHFQVYWSKGKSNKADYYSKHHPASHHTAIRSTYLYSPINATRNYFECLADQEPDSSQPSTSAVQFTLPNDSGEGVLFPPGNPVPGNPDPSSNPEPFA